MSPTLDLAIALVTRPSVTPDDAGCQDILAERLQRLGFTVERLRFGAVDNLWARRGTQPPLFAFAGHTDVVPTGPLGAWDTPPFEPVVRNGALYGRGAADMKGGLAAMITATEAFLARYPDPPGSIAFLITSDEEGPTNENGTVKVVERLQARGETIAWCLVGEPTSLKTLGDTIKNGRRGSLSGRLTVHGMQGHVAYPELAVNPIHRFAPAIAELSAIAWDQGNAYFPPTSFQFSNLHAGTGAENVIPGDLEARFNFRYSTAVTHEELQRRVSEVLDKHGLRYTLAWSLSGKPFLTPVGTLIEATRKAILEVAGMSPELSTGGGTSDGRFIAPTGAQVVELGPLNSSIHKVNEHVRVEDLDTLAQTYERILEILLLAEG
jgi:succinyl-diaminopimelate desuccinylase